MLSQRTQRPAPRGRHLVESNQFGRSRGVNTDVHSASVHEAASKNQMVRKWGDVLNRCREVRPKQLDMMAKLLENTYNHWYSRGRTTLFEDQTTTANIADFTRFALPMLRKSFPRIIAGDLVGVQAMSQPATMIFYMRYKYALSKGRTVAGTQIMRQNTAQSFAKQNGWALDPYYTSQTVKGESGTLNGPRTVVTATLAHRPVLAGTVVVEVFASEEDADPSCDNPSPCLRVSFDANGDADAIQIGDCTEFTDTIEVDAVTTGATEFNHTTGVVKVTLDAGSFPVGAIARINYEYDLEANPFTPEVTMSIDSDSMTATLRRLKTAWSLEASMDMQAVHGIDLEAALTDMMADEMVAEIDREIINDLIIMAAIRADHNFATAPGSSVNFTDRNIALMYKVLEVANVLHRTTLRGPANWMVASSDVCSKFEQLNDFRANDVMNPDGVDVGITNAGQLSSKLKIYKDPLFPNCKLLLGFKGKTEMDTGYIYGPYIPMLSIPTVLDPNSHSPSKGMLCKYGKKALEDGGLFYATINVTNL